MQELFQEKGYIVVRNLLDKKEATKYRQKLEELSIGKRKKWTLPDGVCQEPAFWPIVTHPQILSAIRSVLGEDIFFLQHNDLHVGFSSFAWHRDSVCRHYDIGPDWDETKEPYQLARVGIYLQEESSEFKLGLIKGTHRPQLHMGTPDIRKLERGLSNVNSVINTITGKNLLPNRVEWVATRPGDAIIFDPRVVHTGSDFKEVKYAFFVAYGKFNSHFINHYRYYRYLRKDLNYQPLAPELIKQLQTADLYVEIEDNHQSIEGAWLPSRALSMLVKPFK